MASFVNALLMSDRSDRSEVMAATLSTCGYRIVWCEPFGMDVEVLRHEPKLIVIDVQSLDQTTLRHIQQVSEKHPRPIALFTNSADKETIQQATRAGVSAYVTGISDLQRVGSILDAAIARFECFDELRNELAQTKNSLLERKLIDQAKGILMMRKQMDEPAAYRAMQKMAMDRNTKLVDLARSIIAAAEILA